MAEGFDGFDDHLWCAIAAQCPQQGLFNLLARRVARAQLACRGRAHFEIGIAGHGLEENVHRLRVGLFLQVNAEFDGVAPHDAGVHVVAAQSSPQPVHLRAIAEDGQDQTQTQAVLENADELDPDIALAQRDFVPLIRCQKAIGLIAQVGHFARVEPGWAIGLFHEATHFAHEGIWIDGQALPTYGKLQIEGRRAPAGDEVRNLLHDQLQAVALRQGAGSGRHAVEDVGIVQHLAYDGGKAFPVYYRHDSAVAIRGLLVQHPCRAAFLQLPGIDGLVVLGGYGQRHDYRRAPAHADLRQRPGPASADDEVGGRVRILHFLHVLESAIPRRGVTRDSQALQVAFRIGHGIVLIVGVVTGDVQYQ